MKEKQKQKQIEELLSLLQTYNRMDLPKFVKPLEPISIIELATNLMITARNSEAETLDALREGLKHEKSGFLKWVSGDDSGVTTVSQLIKEVKTIAATQLLNCEKKQFAWKLRALNREELTQLKPFIYKQIGSFPIKTELQEKKVILEKELCFKKKWDAVYAKQNMVVYHQIYPAYYPAPKPPYIEPENPPYDFCKISNPDQDQFQIIKDATGVQLPVYKIDINSKEFQDFLGKNPNDALFNKKLVELLGQGNNKLIYHGDKANEGILEIVDNSGHSSFQLPTKGSYTINVITSNPRDGQYEVIKIKDGKLYTPYNKDGTATTYEQSLELTIASLVKMIENKDSKISEAWLTQQIKDLKKEQELMRAGNAVVEKDRTFKEIAKEIREALAKFGIPDAKAQKGGEIQRTQSVSREVGGKEFKPSRSRSASLSTP